MAVNYIREGLSKDSQTSSNDIEDQGHSGSSERKVSIRQEVLNPSELVFQPETESPKEGVQTGKC